MAVAEAITNIASARILSISDIVLSANWMAACGDEGEDATLFETVRAIGMELCPALGIAIPVGKDSLSMRTVWQDNDTEKSVTSPVSLVVSAFAPVVDVRMSLTPEIKPEPDCRLLLIDLGRGKNRLGGSCLAQVYNDTRGEPADLEQAKDLKDFFRCIQILNEMGLLLAYHDRSDGGLFTTLCEMAFAGRSGLEISLDALGEDPIASLFSEELGAVIQVRGSQVETILKTFAQCGDIVEHVHVLGAPSNYQQLTFNLQGKTILQDDLLALHRLWSETTFLMQSLRDNPDSAEQDYHRLDHDDDPGLSIQLGYEHVDLPAAPAIVGSNRPRMAILREQGINGQIEMAAAFDRAGFDAVDVHMSDIIAGRITLDEFRGLVACGGFSYGDVLGAGGGWASSILYNPQAREQFSNFFQRDDSFALGVCNGCQMMSQLHELIPGAEHWPAFKRNMSDVFEARLVMVEVQQSSSILFAGMAGARMPIAVAHGEGRVEYRNTEQAARLAEAEQIALRYIDNSGNVTEQYPHNPNGSPQGITGLTTVDGRFTIMMPHPERVFLSRQYSWAPYEWKHETTPWMTMFANARKWVDQGQ
jgi:phosphoribosylformylglycinamidine synthase